MVIIVTIATKTSQVHNGSALYAKILIFVAIVMKCDPIIYMILMDMPIGILCF
jgi:hypothetical protein